MKEENTMVTNTEELIEVLKNGLTQCNRNSAQRKMTMKSKKGMILYYNSI
jgi:hypothetical protein